MTPSSALSQRPAWLWRRLSARLGLAAADAEPADPEDRHRNGPLDIDLDALVPLREDDDAWLTRPAVQLRTQGSTRDHSGGMQ